MEYLPCAKSDRMKTCAVVMGTSVSLPTQDLCQEGCYCKEGMVLDGDRCVDEKDCGCNYKGEYYTVGGSRNLYNLSFQICSLYIIH